MFNLITHKINAEYSDYLYTHFLFETNGSAPNAIKKSLAIIDTFSCIHNVL